MKLRRRKFLRLAAGAAALQAVPRLAQRTGLSGPTGALDCRVRPRRRQ